MIVSETDLYACGRKVQYIRSPSPTLSPRARYSSGDQRPATTKEHLHRAPKHLPPLNSHLKELGQSLDFSDEVITEISPHLLSYAKSKQRAVKCLFRPDDLGINTHSRPPRNAPIGRHNCRGDMKRHLPCHLVESPSGDNRKTFDNRNSRHYSTDWNTDTDTKTTTKAGIYMAPSNKSVLWEDETLGKVSSYTARRLTGKPSNISIEDSSRSLLNRQQSSIVKNTSSLAFFDMFSESEGLVSPPPRGYLSEFQDGARPVHQKMADRTKLVLDSGAKFDAVVEDSFPYSPTEWCGAASEAEKKETKIENVRGYRKWLDFPQPAQTSEDLLWACHDVSVLPPSKSSELSLSSHPSFQGTKNKELFYIMHEWRKKWQLHLQLKDVASHNSILLDLQNVCDTIRMLAVTSIALLAEQQALSVLKLSPSSSSSSSSSEKQLAGVSGEMVEALIQRLEDATEHVRVPSAITLYCMDKQNEKAEEVLLAAISGSNAVESWASVQALAIVGVATLTVVEALLHHLQDQSGLTARRASQLLASLSSNTHLVHSVLSESLNCSGWLERLSACQMMPKLHGGITRDVCQKLVYLAWNDWSPEVRTGAAQALGLTGHAKLIHDEVGRRLTDASEMIRLDALKKLHSLHLMTAQLLPPFLSCFSDTFISIRIQAVKMAGALKLTHTKVRDALLYLLTHDSCCKVKVATLQAIAECGVVDEGLVTQLVWVVRFEKLGSVRAEGCRTIGRLGLREEKVVRTLRDLLTVEDDPDVKSEATQTLEQLGSCEGPEDDMLEMICSEVKRLGTQETITAAVLGSDRTTITHKAILGATRPVLTTRDMLNYAGNRALTHSQDSSREIQTTSNALTTETITPVKPPPTLRSASVQSDSSSPSLTDNHTDTDIVAVSTKDKLPDVRAKRHNDKKVWSLDKEGINGLLQVIRTSLDS